MKIKGKLIDKLEIETGTSQAGKEWKKQTFVIETGDKYPTRIAFDSFKEDVLNAISILKKGAEIEVHFNLDSREWKGKWYTNVTAWKIDGAIGTDPEKAETATEDDGLPF